MSASRFCSTRRSEMRSSWRRSCCSRCCTGPGWSSTRKSTSVALLSVSARPSIGAWLGFGLGVRARARVRARAGASRCQPGYLSAPRG
jgi:hypothetical protein